MSTSATKRFEWELKTILLEFTIKGEKQELEAYGFLSQGTNTTSRFLQFPSLYQDFVIGIEDLRKRVDDSTYQAELQKDLTHGSISCPLFTVDGLLAKADQLKSSRMVRSLLQIKKANLKTSLDEYRRRWMICLDGALEVAESKKAVPGRFDVLNRFFTPSNKYEFRLCLVPGTLPDGTPADSMLKACIGSVKPAFAKGVDPTYYPVDESTAIEKQLVKISTNPLGLYSTWIEQKTLNTLKLLIDAQTDKDGTWIRPRPTTKQVEVFNKSQDEKIRKYDSVFASYTDKLVQFPGDQLFYYRRMNTQAIMGLSANKWATETLKWKGRDEEVRAEWLHLIAHRFDPRSTDVFRNIIFGTKECNTDMMRAEAAVTQLLVSGKVYGVGITATARYHLQEVTMVDDSQNGDIAPGPRSFDVPWVDPSTIKHGKVMVPHPHWLTPQLEYEITVFVPNKDKDAEVHRTTNIFNPFSRQCPFRFEYELDKIMLERYLFEVETPTDAEMEGMRGELVKRLSGEGGDSDEKEDQDQ